MKKDLDRMRKISDDAAGISHDANVIAQELGEIGRLTRQVYDVYHSAVSDEIIPFDFHESNLGAFMGSIEVTLDKIKQSITEARGSIPIVSGTADTYANTAASTSTVLANDFILASPQHKNLRSTLASRHNKPEVSKRLGLLAPHFKQKYDQLCQQIALPGPDKGRPALLEARQLWDELFRNLAPDAKVREQGWWPPDNDRSNRDQVTRLDRLRYTLEGYIADPIAATNLRVELIEHSKLRGRLDDLHQYGDADTESAVALAGSMIASINEWVIGLDFKLITRT